MKSAKRPPMVKEVTSDAQSPGTLLGELLSKDSHQTPQLGIPTVALGTVRHIDEQGAIWVQLADSGSFAPVKALSTCTLTTAHLGAQCAVQFINGNTQQPLIIGLIQPSSAPSTATPTSQSSEISEIEEALHIQAQEEILLECGESSIRLSADGVIELRGVYISSDAAATQRLRGGSVQVN